MKTSPEKSIRFPLSVHQKLQKLALKHGRSQIKLFMQMVDYFYSTKKDPQDINDDVLKNALADNHKTYIKFIRAQEQTLLIPIKTDVDRMIESQKKVLNCFSEQVLNANETLLKRQEEQTIKFTETDKAIKVIAERSEIKEKLKQKFLYILNNYIRARDQFSMMTSAKEKDELILETRKQVINL